MLYREFRAPTGLESSVACLWQREAMDGGEVRVVPDGCVDILWFGEDLLVAGADTGPVVWNRVPAVSGVRLRTGAAGRFLGVPASEVRDQMIALSEFWPEAHRLGGTAVAGAGQLRTLTQMVSGHRSEPDSLVAAAAHVMAAGESRVRVVAHDLGVSERHLHRRINDAVGYGPKTLARVLRMRRLVTTPAGSLAARAHASGYASQSHMTDEIKRLTGLTPVRFLEDVPVTAS